MIRSPNEQDTTSRSKGDSVMPRPMFLPKLICLLSCFWSLNEKLGIFGGEFAEESSGAKEGVPLGYKEGSP